MPYYPERKPEEPGGTKKQPEKTEKRNRLVRTVLFALSGLLVIYGSIRLIGYTKDLFASRQTSEELRQVSREPEVTQALPPETTDSPKPSAAPATELPAAAPAPEQTDRGLLLPASYPDNPELKVSSRFINLRKKSGYIVGWLTLDGVDEPVVLKDNTFFLDHDAMGKKNSNGAIFLDSGISLLPRPYTVILYGHNMKSGNMFGRLKKYKYHAYYFRHRIVTFDSLYEEGKYAVFAVLEFSTEPGAANWFDFWSLNSDKAEEREKAIRKLEERSVHGRELDVQADEQILLLVTCTDGDSERLMVAARRLRTGETEENLTYRQP